MRLANLNSFVVREGIEIRRDDESNSWTLGGNDLTKKPELPLIYLVRCSIFRGSSRRGIGSNHHLNRMESDPNAGAGPCLVASRVSNELRAPYDVLVHRKLEYIGGVIVIHVKMLSDSPPNDILNRRRRNIDAVRLRFALRGRPVRLR